MLVGVRERAGARVRGRIVVRGRLGAGTHGIKWAAVQWTGGGTSFSQGSASAWVSGCVGERVVACAWHLYQYMSLARWLAVFCYNVRVRA